MNKDISDVLIREPVMNQDIINQDIIERDSEEWSSEDRDQWEGLTDEYLNSGDIDLTEDYPELCASKAQENMVAPKTGRFRNLRMWPFFRAFAS